MNNKQIINIIVILIMAGWMSVYFGNYLKEYNPWFKGIDLIFIISSFFIFCMISLVVSYSFVNYSKYSKEFKEEYKDVENKPHKQTYLEYVTERLKVERMLK